MGFFRFKALNVEPDRVSQSIDRRFAAAKMLPAGNHFGTWRRAKPPNDEQT